MLKILVLIILLFIDVFSLSAGEYQILTIAKPIQDYPPYHWQEDGEIKGLFPALLKLAAKRSNKYKLEFKLLPWKRMLSMAKKGEVDAVMPIIATQQRRDYLFIVDTPLIHEHVAFIKKSKTHLNYDGQFIELLPYTIGVIDGYDYGESFKQLNFNQVVVPDERTQYKMLIAGRYPIMLMDTNIIPFYQALVDPKITEPVSALSPPISTASLHLAFSKSRDLLQQAKEFAVYIDQVKNSEEYQRIKKIYLK